MIGFRYHVVSIIAVFLALGLGILMGSTVLDRAVVDGLESQLRRLSGNLEDARTEIIDLRRDVDRTSQLVEQLGPWATEGRLADRPTLFVYDGGGGRWRAETQAAFVRAGATTIGSVTFTEKWSLRLEGSREELELVVRSVTPAFEPGEDLVDEVLSLLGERLLEPTGRALLDRLVDSRFLTLERAQTEGEWPPPGTAAVAFASPHRSGAPNPGWLASFTRGVAAVAPTAVVGEAPGGHDAVRVIRDGEAVPSTLATFDSAGDDPTGVGAVLSLEAAIRRVGSHFGAEDGLRFLPDVPRETTEAPGDQTA